MDKSFFESLFSRLTAPEKVVVKFIDNKYAFIDSIDSINDSYDWFYVNSNLIEEALQKKGLRGVTCLKLLLTSSHAYICL